MANWTSVEQAMPRQGRAVAVAQVDRNGRRQVTLAYFYSSMAWEVQGWDHDHATEEWCDYDPEKDLYYYPEGWYEYGHEMDKHFHISATVTHWMPMPATLPHGETDDILSSYEDLLFQEEP